MKNNFINKLKSSIKINVKGKNIKNFIKKLINSKIEIIKLDYINRNEVNLIIYEKDYENILKQKTIYEIDMLDVYGFIKIKKNIKSNKFIIIFLIIGISIILFLSNTIFNVKVIHNNKEIRELLISELKKYGIKKGNFKKSYKKIEEIKKKILNDYKDKLQWLEIEESGTNYIIKVEERKINNENIDSLPRNVVAKKAGVIKNIVASNGVIIKNVNDYVNKGDIIITGEVKLNEEVKDVIPASGKVYAEVWYKTKVEYPYTYKETKYTGKKKEVFLIKFLNNKFNFFYFKKFKTSLNEEIVLIKDNIFPISFVKQIEKETVEIDEIYTYDEVIEKAVLRNKEKIKSKLKEDEKILSYKKLKIEAKKSTIVVEVFFSVYEDITDYENTLE